MPEDIGENFFGDIAEDVTSIIIKDILHEIRPDVILKDEFPEISSAFEEASPRSIIKGIVKEIMRG